MLDYSRVDKTRTETLGYLPNVNLLLKISLGLILFTIISTALVYAETVSLTADGNSSDIEYTAEGVSVLAIEQIDSVSLIIDVDVTGSSGILDIIFERTIFDSIFNDIDDDFYVLSDGLELTFSETQTNSVSRTLSIELPAGTTEVEIIGSSFNNSVAEETVEETPVEETVEETPVEETVEETPVEETPRTQCGPGTVLKDGACVLDERCGPGTSLEDGVCVLDSTPAPTSSTSKGQGKELIIAVVAGIVIAGTIGVILAIMSKASKSSD